MRLLGIDYGLKKIGIAFGDLETKMAMPVEVMRPDGKDPVALIKKLIADEGVEEVVVGVPMKAGDHSSEQFDITKKFIDDLRSVIDMPVHEVDERYTSAESQRLQKEYGAQAEEDALAAMLILQSYLDNK